MTAKAIMIQGTASDVGKSLICTALCRIFSDEGNRVAPFKSQNMALNSFVTRDGGEIGRAQGVQAEAARTEARVDMNPILLKPKQDMVAEVIVRGKHYLDMSATTYRNDFVEQVMPLVAESFHALQAAHDIIVIEGAGSPAEINLKDRDIANMRMARLADAAVILVADIDKGGVFASIIGTLSLLEEWERKHVKGIIINKFRGMKELLDDGVEWLENETGIPILGVLPYIDVHIDAEDSLALSSLRFKQPKQGEFPVDVAMVRLPRISNFTDIDPFFDEPEVGVRLVSKAADLGTPDLLVIPGTKNTLSDLAWLKNNGFDKAIRELREQGRKIIGLCGGYQILGHKLSDEFSFDGEGGTASGLGLLPVNTVFEGDKRTVRMSGRQTGGSAVLSGYEIHLGRTTIFEKGATPFLDLPDGRTDGAISADGQVIGSYFHGLFHNRDFTRELVNEIRCKKGLSPLSAEVVGDTERREMAYDLLAEQVRTHIDMAKLHQLLDQPVQSGSKRQEKI